MMLPEISYNSIFEKSQQPDDFESKIKQAVTKLKHELKEYL